MCLHRSFNEGLLAHGFEREPSRMKTMKTAFTASGVSLIALMIAYPASALAQQAIVAQDASSYNFNIPSKPLLSALADFTATTGIQIVRQNGSAIAGKSGAVIGRQSAEAALKRVLGDSKLLYRFVDSRTVSLFAPDENSSNAVSSRAADGSVQLNTITINSSAANINGAAAVYSAPRSSIYISSEDLARYGAISAADVLKGLPGVQVGDSRNGGGVDVNIRGIQGQSRVAVTVDGSQQALNIYRGYAGTQQRSYFDQDLISDIQITKGPGLNASTAGAIGGAVAMTTLQVKDILRPGQKYGVRLTGQLWDNGIKPEHRASEVSGSSALVAVPRDGKRNLFNSDAKSGSAAFAFSSDRIDIVAAYARRNQGNYITGKRGYDQYRLFSKSGYEENSAAKSYKPGEEVLNSSAKTESILLKANIRPADDHELELSYRRFDGRFGEIMPSDIFRYGTGGIYQYPAGDILINSASARYTFDPADNDLINLKSTLWWTDAASNQINGVNGPKSQQYVTDRNWVRMDNKRIGGDLSNDSKFSTGIGEFNLNLGGAFQHEDIRPQDGVVISEHDINQNRMLRDGNRTEFNLTGQLDYKPVDTLTFWGGARFSMFRSKDNNAPSTAVREDIYGRWVRVIGKNGYGNMYWRPDENGAFTDATDPRLNNGIVFSDTNNPFDGIHYNDYGATSSQVYNPSVTNTVTGFTRGEKMSARDSGFSPALGVNYEIAPATFIYASYTQGLRMPSLFETTIGTTQVDPGKALKPERSQNWEIGASTTLDSFFTNGDTTSAKLAYFNTNIKDYIARYYEPSGNGLMIFTNAESYKTSGLEFQSNYDNGRIFADLSATYYFKTETCDPAFAAGLRASANQYRRTENTPDCTPGSFMGSYTNTQNPPKYAVNATLGSRFFEQKLTIGGRMTYTSGPVEEINKPWQTGATTPQIIYHPVTLFDAFVSYKLREDAVINASVQNITNRYYLDPLAQSYMPAPGRTYRAGFSVKF